MKVHVQSAQDAAPMWALAPALGPRELAVSESRGGIGRFRERRFLLSTRVRRRRAEAASSSQEKSGKSSAPKKKPPPSVLVGTNFVAGSEGVKNKDYNPYTDKFAKDWSDPDAERKKRGETTALSYEAISMYLASAILGPMLDHQHSRFDVLHYEDSGSGRVILNFPEVAAKALWGPDGVPPASVVQWFDRVHAVIPEGLDDVLSAAFVRETGVLETALWVPLLFGGAGVVIGVGHTLGDMFRLKTGAKEDRFIEGNTPLPRFLEECPGKPRLGWEPEWGVVYSGIGLFAMQYATSGILATTVNPPFPDMPSHAIDAILAAWALGQWAVFDYTKQGLTMAVLTGVAGPVTEIFLINVLHLYHYSDPDFFGIPSWIAWVYFCGSPAVGNLSRAVRGELRRRQRLQTPTCEVALAAPKKAWRPPPRGNARGKRQGATAVEQPARGKMTVVLPNQTEGSNAGAKNGAGKKAVGGAKEVPSTAAKARPSASVSVKPPPEDDGVTRVQTMRKELEWMRSLQNEINDLQALKRRLEALRDAANEAAPPILPMIERRLGEVVPDQYKTRLETLESAFEQKVLPKLPDKVRKRVGSRSPSAEEKATRMNSLKGLNKELRDVQKEIVEVKTRIDMSFDSDIRPPRHSEKREDSGPSDDRESEDATTQ